MLELEVIAKDVRITDLAAPGAVKVVSVEALGPDARIVVYRVDLNSVRAKFDFARIVDEVIQPFTARVGVEVTVSVEIQARLAEGFDEAPRRAVRENCRALKFTHPEFELRVKPARTPAGSHFQF